MNATDIFHVLSLWKPSIPTPIDPSLIELCYSDFFRHYRTFTQQYIGIFDHSTMKYLYVPDNLGTDLGFPVEDMRKEGIKALMHLYHPDDIEKLITISSLMNQTLKTLTVEEVLECRTTFDYRMLAGDGQYRRLLQHHIPLTVDENRSIGHVLIIATDISAYKKQNYSGYKIVRYNRGSPVTLMEGIVGEQSRNMISKRELEVIRLTADGLTEKEIAAKLFVSIQTIKTHRKNILRKTGVSNSAEMVKWAMANLYL